MGQQFSQSQINNLADRRTFLGLPQEVRVYMLLYHVPPQDLAALRQVCRTLCNDIDEYIGPTDCLDLNNQKSMKIYEFYSQTFFPRIEISKSCLFDGFQNILYKPERIRSLTLNKPDGIINSIFLEEFLENSKGLNVLNLNGIIIGPVSRQGCLISLPHLKTLQLLISDEVYKTIATNLVTFVTEIVQRLLLSNPTKIQRALEILWETQLALLKRLSVPACEEIVLGLNYRPNLAQEDFDEIELVQTVFNFIARHPNCRRYKIQSRVFLSSWFSTQQSPRAPRSEHSFYYQRQKALYPEDPIERPDETQLSPSKNKIRFINLKIKELTYVSEITEVETTLETHLYQFLKSLKGLQKLNIATKWPRPIQLPLFVEIVQKNASTLTEIVITGRTQSFRNIPEFHIFSTSPCLKTLWIDISHIKGNLPFNLTPTRDTIANLRTLVLKGTHKIEPKYLKTIPDLINLKYLCLTYLSLKRVWTTTWGTVPIDAIKGILKIRSLEGVILPMEYIVYPNGWGEPRSAEGLKIYRPLRSFVDPDYFQLLISNRVTPWWTRMENAIYEPVEYHEPGRIVSK